MPRSRPPVRTPAGKEALGRVLLGDPAIADVLVGALAQAEPVERATHGFHTYPAGLHPEAARDLIAAFPGRSLFDPFCGGGTILVEARIAGRAAFGSDLSPTALRVARARTSTADEATLTRFRSLSRKLTEAARTAKERPPDRIFAAVEEWYAPHAIFELEALRKGIEDADADIKPLLEATFSSILIKTSWRRSDTSGQRVKHDRPAETTAILFHKKARELGRRIAALRELVPPGTHDAVIRASDARTRWLREPVDLILTSPPYPATYDYLRMQHLRRIWFGDPGDDRGELGPRHAWREGGGAARKEWMADTAAWMRAAAEALSPGGHLVIVIGDGLTPAGMVDTSEPTELAAKGAGLTAVARASVEREDHAREAYRWEHVFAFRR